MLSSARVIAVNIKGTFLGLRHGLPVMVAQQAGSIINAASVAGTVGTPDEVARVVVFLASDDAAYVNGAAWLIDGGRTAI